MGIWWEDEKYRYFNQTILSKKKSELVKNNE